MVTCVGTCLLSINHSLTFISPEASFPVSSLILFLCEGYQGMNGVVTSISGLRSFFTRELRSRLSIDVQSEEVEFSFYSFCLVTCTCFNLAG